MIDLSGKRVLVVDDVADTGETVEIVSQHVLEKNAVEVKTAVIDFKHTSKFVPDYYAREMEGWRWIVYPWSIYVDTRDLIAKLNGCSKCDVKEIVKRLKEVFDFNVDERVVNEVIEG